MVKEREHKRSVLPFLFRIWNLYGDGPLETPPTLPKKRRPQKSRKEDRRINREVILKEVYTS